MSRKHLGLVLAAAIAAGCSSAADGGGGDWTGDAGGTGATGSSGDDGGVTLGHPGHDGGSNVEVDATTPHPEAGGAGGDSGVVVPPDSGYVDRGPNPSTVLVRVSNGCPVDLWIHAQAKEATLTPDNAHLAPGATQDYDAPLTWSSGRVSAYLQAPDANGNPQGDTDKIEANFYVQNGSEYLNTDITYVDWVALPSRIQTFGTGNDCTTVGCDATFAHILDGCPGALLAGHECISAGYHCLTTSNPNDPYCHALDAQIGSCAAQYADCAGASGSTTAQVYSCSGGFFGGNPQYCAALNRGVLASPGASTPAASFYQSPPFNTYAQWAHQTCPGIYAFPYDDFGNANQSSDHTCTGATQLNVTFCPKG